MLSRRFTTWLNSFGRWLSDFFRGFLGLAMTKNHNIETNESLKRLRHSAAIGDLAGTWEYLEDSLEVAVLHLSGCADYRGRVLTKRLGFRKTLNAIRKLVKHKYGPNAIAKGSTFRELSNEINKLYDHRNRIIHASWQEWKVGSDGSTAIYKSEESLQRPVEETVTTDEIKDYIARIAQAHEDLLNFLIDQCEFVAWPGIYDWPQDQ